jgi:hypothetical protein
VRGDDETAPLASRRRWQEMERQQDPREQLALFAHLHRQICDREAAVFAQLEAAAGADPEARQLLAEHDQRRYDTQRRLARSLHRRKQLKTGTSGPRGRRRHLDARERAHLSRARTRPNDGKPTPTSDGSPNSSRPASYRRNRGPRPCIRLCAESGATLPSRRSAYEQRHAIRPRQAPPQTACRQGDGRIQAAGGTRPGTRRPLLR